MRLSTASLIGAIGCIAEATSLGIGAVSLLDMAEYFESNIQLYYYLSTNIVGFALAVALLAFFVQLYKHEKRNRQ